MLPLPQKDVELCGLVDTVHAGGDVGGRRGGRVQGRQHFRPRSVGTTGSVEGRCDLRSVPDWVYPARVDILEWSDSGVLQLVSKGGSLRLTSTT